MEQVEHDSPGPRGITMLKRRRHRPYGQPWHLERLSDAADPDGAAPVAGVAL